MLGDVPRLTITEPITDGGWIIANNTDRANFGGNAKVLADLTMQGQQNYQDQGPVQAMYVHSTEITAAPGARLPSRCPQAPARGWR